MGRLLETGIAMAEELFLFNGSGHWENYFCNSGLRWASLLPVPTSSCCLFRPDDLNLRAKNRLVLSFMAGVGSTVLRRAGGLFV